MDVSLIKWKTKQNLQKLLIPNKTKVFFLHIPKSGGTSIDKAIRKHYRHSYSRIEAAPSHQTAKMLYGIDIEKGETDKRYSLENSLLLMKCLKKHSIAQVTYLIIKQHGKSFTIAMFI